MKNIRLGFQPYLTQLTCHPQSLTGWSLQCVPTPPKPCKDNGTQTLAGVKRDVFRNFIWKYFDLFDFCCISRCSGENSPNGGFSVANFSSFVRRSLQL